MLLFKVINSVMHQFFQQRTNITILLSRVIIECDSWYEIPMVDFQLLLFFRISTPWERWHLIHHDRMLYAHLPMEKQFKYSKTKTNNNAFIYIFTYTIRMSIESVCAWAKPGQRIEQFRLGMTNKHNHILFFCVRCDKEAEGHWRHFTINSMVDNVIAGHWPLDSDRRISRAHTKLAINVNIF